MSDSEDSRDNDDFVMPAMEFEEVVVEDSPTLAESNTEESAPADEFFFPLFSQTETAITLTEEAEPEINNERPHSYYYVDYSDADRARFHAVAVSGSDVIAGARQPASTLLVAFQQSRVFDITAHNRKIDAARKKKKRAGKNKRLGLKACRERKQQREKEIKKIQRQATHLHQFKRARSANAKPVVNKKPRFATE